MTRAGADVGGVAFCLVLAALAACSAPRAPSAKSAPTAPGGEHGGSSKKWHREPMALVPVMTPAGFERVDIEDAVKELDNPRIPFAMMPDAPSVPLPERPAFGGEALELADLALARGDAFDATVQYRALLPKLDPRASEYAQLQLARAYIALGDRNQGAAYCASSTEGARAQAQPSNQAIREVLDTASLPGRTRLAPRVYFGHCFEPRHRSRSSARTSGNGAALIDR